MARHDWPAPTNGSKWDVSALTVAEPARAAALVGVAEPPARRRRAGNKRALGQASPANNVALFPCSIVASCAAGLFDSEMSCERSLQRHLPKEKGALQRHVADDCERDIEDHAAEHLQHVSLVPG